jgi:diketogulonate reductase-like aldo/keto reductase
MISLSLLFLSLLQISPTHAAPAKAANAAKAGKQQVLARDEFKVLPNKVKIPTLGYGTYKTPPGSETYDAVLLALKNGYRHIDTAAFYGNEKDVGRAVRDSGIAREKIFICTKLPAEIKNYEAALASFEQSLKDLDLGYIDLYIIHAPWPWNQMGASDDKGNREAWRALEKIYASGRAKAIGVSNFDIKDLQNLLPKAKIKPMVNQIKIHIGHAQPELVKFNRKAGITVVGYSTLGSGKILSDERLVKLAQKYNVSVAQLSIRYSLQKQIVPLVKATNESYIKENLDVDFEISAADMRYLDSIKI